MAQIKPQNIRTCPKWLDEEMQNWARYCWLGAWPHPLPPSQCASLEGNYVRINPNGETESEDYKPIPVCEENARLVQQTYDVMAVVHQLVLRAEYPQRHEWGSAKTDSRKAAARFVGLHSEDQYLSILASALYRVQAVLEGAR